MVETKKSTHPVQLNIQVVDIGSIVEYTFIASRQVMNDDGSIYELSYKFDPKKKHIKDLIRGLEDMVYRIKTGNAPVILQGKR